MTLAFPSAKDAVPSWVGRLCARVSLAVHEFNRQLGALDLAPDAFLVLGDAGSYGVLVRNEAGFRLLAQGGRLQSLDGRQFGSEASARDALAEIDAAIGLKAVWYA
ncbi:hypothetical protein [Alsobacter sp. SYSU BS001988]|jgi:hypothetical protein